MCLAECNQTQGRVQQPVVVTVLSQWLFHCGGHWNSLKVNPIIELNE